MLILTLDAGVQTWADLFGLNHDQLSPTGSPSFVSLTTTNDAVINDMTVGHGGGNRALNTAYGLGALASNIGGDNIVAIGLDAGRYESDQTTPLESCSNCLFVGDYTSQPDNTNNGIVIGIGAVGRGSNTTTIGKTTTSSTVAYGTFGFGQTFLATMSAAGLSANRSITIPDAAGTMTLLGNTAVGTGSVVLASAPTMTNIIVNQAADGDAAFTSTRATDTAPTGSFIACKTAAGSNRFLISANGAVTITRDDVSGAVESMMTLTLAGDASSSFSISNGTSTNSVFAPKIQGVQSTTLPGLNFGGQSTTDTGTSPVILFAAQIGSGTVSTRPCFEFRNLSTMMVQFNASNITLADSYNIVLNSTTGTKIGTGTGQKLSFWNKTPIIQPTTGITGATFTANSGTAVNDASTFGGYTLAKIAAALINVGLLA